MEKQINLLLAWLKKKVMKVLESFHYWSSSLENTLKHFISLLIRLMHLLRSPLHSYFYIYVYIFLCVYVCIYAFILLCIYNVYAIWYICIYKELLKLIIFGTNFSLKFFFVNYIQRSNFGSLSLSIVFTKISLKMTSSNVTLRHLRYFSKGCSGYFFFRLKKDGFQ